jgi:hypothetical protein
MARTRIVVFGSQPFSAQADRIAKLNKQYERRRPEVARAPVPATLWYLMPPSYASSHTPYGDRSMRPTSGSTRSAKPATAPRRTATNRGTQTLRKGGTRLQRSAGGVLIVGASCRGYSLPSIC